MPIQHITFISTTRLKKDTALGGSVDNNMLLPYILQAQDRFIFPILGTDLHQKLKDLITANTISGNYQILLETYIQPALVHFSFAEVLPYLRLRFVNNSVVAMNTEQGNSVTYEELKPLINRTEDIAEFYRQRLIDYLTNNTTLFAEYSTNTGADLNPTTQNYYAGLNLDVQSYNPKQLQIKSVISAMGIKTIEVC